MDNGAGIAEYVTLDDKVEFNKKDAADLLAEHFHNVYESDDTSETPIVTTEKGDNRGNWSDMFISMSQVYDKLKCLVIKKAVGPDKLPPVLFKRCAAALTFPLHMIFNDSIKTGIFPSA